MIEFQRISMHYGERQVLFDLDLSIPQGVYALLGPNGAGKTTCLRIMLGLVRPSGGRCRVAGIDVAEDPLAVRRRCGALLEDVGLYESCSVAENLAYYASLYGLEHLEGHARIRELAGLFGFSDRLDQPSGELSRGWKKKVGIARALLASPQVLFLDEPSNGLDPTSAEQLVELLRQVSHEQGVTLLLTTHNLDEVERLCSHVGLLYQGRLITSGSLEAVRSRWLAPRLLLECPMPVSPDVVARLADLEAVTDVREDAQGLELGLTRADRSPEVLRRALELGLELRAAARRPFRLGDAYRAHIRAFEQGSHESP